MSVTTEAPATGWHCPLCLATGTEPGVRFCPQDGTPVEANVERGAEWLQRTLADRYRIESLLGAGGYAEVFAASVLGSERRVAIKLLRAACDPTARASDRFRQEAELVSLVAHPNVVAIQDFGTAENGTPYMVMELLAGESLGARLAREPIAPAVAMRIALQVCEGLAAAHERGVIHRDIKPDNLFLVPSRDTAVPHVKILDLGIAKIVGDSSPPRHLTMQGLVTGTPEYMSPEQACAGPVGPGADIYSLACVLWEMLLGSPPFQEPNVVALLARHVGEVPTWPHELAAARGIPAGAAMVLLRALAKSPAERPASMLDFQAEIARIARRSRFPDEARPTPPLDPRRTEPPVSSAPTVARGVAITRVGLGAARTDDGTVVEIAEDVFWVGRRHGGRLECNPYLRRFRGNGREVNVLIDPGGQTDAGVVLAKLTGLLGSLDAVSYVFLNHQDPDVASAAPRIQSASRAAHVITSEDTWRLVQTTGLSLERFTTVESLVDGALVLPTGHRLQCIPTPFCHSRGAVMLYDPEARVLFSGDLFGGATEAPGLIADEESWPGIELFHQIYMPTQRAVRAAIARIRAIEPPPLVIAPQHGALLLAEQASAAMTRLEQLPVGLDLLDHQDAAVIATQRYANAANDILDALTLLVGEAPVTELLHRHRTDSSFTNPLVLREPREVMAFKGDPAAGLSALERDVLASVPPESRSVLERVIRRTLERHGVAPSQGRKRSDRAAGYHQVFERPRTPAGSRSDRR